MATRERTNLLRDAAREGACATMATLLANGATLDGADVHGYTALHNAAMWGKAEAVAFLLARGADAALRSNHGAETALGLATQVRAADRCHRCSCWWCCWWCCWC